MLPSDLTIMGKGECKVLGTWHDILERLVAACAPMGFELTSDTDFDATLRKEGRSAIRLSGDRASYPAFSLDIFPDHENYNDNGYSVWLLMQVFSDEICSAQSEPNVDNQLWFLENFGARILQDPAFYRERYSFLESTPSL